MWTALLLCLASSDPVHPDLADLAARWKGAMEACDVSALGMVLVEGDEVVHRVTLGRRDPGREAPVTKDTLFYIASATKPYVAFAVGQLAEAGKLELDAPVKRYLPRLVLADAELSETITVRDLLSHRHGLNSGPIVMLGLAVVAAGAGGQVLARLVSTDVHERLLADDRVFDPLPDLLARVRAEKQAETVAGANAPPLELSLPLASYAGTYGNEWFGTLRLEVRGDRLAGQLGELAFECAGAGPERLRVRAPGAFTESGEFTLQGARVQAFTLELSGPVRFERP